MACNPIPAEKAPSLNLFHFIVFYVMPFSYVKLSNYIVTIFPVIIIVLNADE